MEVVFDAGGSRCPPAAKGRGRRCAVTEGMHGKRIGAVLSQVPAEFSESFLHRNPINRDLLGSGARLAPPALP